MHKHQLNILVLNCSDKENLSGDSRQILDLVHSMNENAVKCTKMPVTVVVFVPPRLKVPQAQKVNLILSHSYHHHHQLGGYLVPHFIGAGPAMHHRLTETPA